MKSGKILTIITAISLISGSYRSIAQTAEELLPKGIQLEEVKGELGKAIEVYQTILTQFSANRPIASKALIHIGLCNEKLGNTEARKAYERVLRDYPDQTEMVALAKTKLAQLTGAVSESTLKAEQSFKLAGDLYKEFKYESASAEYEKVIRLAPGSKLAGEAQFWIGQCQFKEGNYTAALKAFENTLREYPKSSVVPVTELMITQTKQANIDGPKKSPVKWIDDKNIQDPRTGIKYTKKGYLVGNNNIVDLTTTSLFNISPNEKFGIFGNVVLPFDNSDKFSLTKDRPAESYCQLSFDGTLAASITGKDIQLIKVSPETGRPVGDPQKLMNSEKSLLMQWFGIKWSPDNTHLAFSISQGNDVGYQIWTLGTEKGNLKQITKSLFQDIYPTYSKNGKNILFLRSGGRSSIKMIPEEGGRSVTLIDSCKARIPFYLSRDNDWIIYDHTVKNFMLFRIKDLQQKALPIPDEVGELISWAPQGNTIRFFRPSYDYHTSVKTISAFGGPAIELGDKLSEPNSIKWTLDNHSILTVTDQSVFQVPLTNESTKNLGQVITEGELKGFSPDLSKVLIFNGSTQFKGDIQIAPFSLIEGKITGPAKTIFANYVGYGSYTWSPDSKSVSVNAKGSLWICDIGGGDPKELIKTDLPPNRFYQRWSPDGKYIAFYARFENPLQIVRVSDGSILQTIDSVAIFDWTKNSAEITIAYPGGQIVNLNILTGEQKPFANWENAFPEIYDLKWSPDGKFIGFIGYYNDLTGYGHLFIMNALKGEIKEIAVEENESKDEVNWSPDSKWLAYSTWGSKKVRPEGTLWEADLSDFMNTMKPGKEEGFTTDLDINALASKLGDVKPDGTFTDARDGHVYKYKKIGEQTWMAENLAWLPKVSQESKVSPVDRHYYVYGYDGTDVKAAKSTENFQNYGVLYNWAAATNGDSDSNLVPSGVQGACPAGWHLPSDAEWLKLEKTLGMSEEDLAKQSPDLRLSGSVGSKLISFDSFEEYEPFIGQSGFNSLPGGILGAQGKFVLINQQANYWTSTLQNNRLVFRSVIGSGPGIYRQSSIVTWPSGSFPQSTPIGRFAISVRCVRDK